MKKFFKVLAVVLVVAMLATMLVACKDDKEDETAKASNAETLGTTAAVVANCISSGSASAAGDTESEQPEEGVNISFGANAGLVATGIGAAINATLKPSLDYIVELGVGSVQNVAAEGAVKVEQAATCDDASFDVQYNITVTHYDNELEKDVVDSFKLYVDADGADINGTKDYHFTAKFVAVVGEGEEASAKALLSFSGDCKYDSTIDGMKFIIAVDIPGIAEASVSAYATKAGTIAINVNGNVLGTVEADVTVELGKLADNKYGANVTVSAGVAGYTAKVNVSVSGEKVTKVVEEENVIVYQFVVNGNLEIKTPEIASKIYKVTATLAGTASYDVNADEFKVYLEGNANYVEEAAQEA
jgi:hypothetical protein